MKLLTLSLSLLCLSAACRAQEFTLQDDKGKTNGPFVLKVGAEVAIGSNKAVISTVGTQKMERMFIRRYTVMPNVIERSTGIERDLHAGRVGQEAAPADDFKKLFGNFGLNWPVGSYISYLSIIGKLQVCNTRANLDLFEKVLADMNVTPRQIQIDVQFVAFDLTNINQLVASGPGISTASLTALWVAGKGELLAAPTVVTKAGQEAVVKGVTEYIYPTQFTVIGLQSNTNANYAADAVVEPGGFQICDVGAVLQVVPEVSAEGQMINLTLNPEIKEDPIWEDYGPASRDAKGKELHLPMRQPFFHVYAASTSVSIYNGKRVLVGGGMPSRDKKRAVYFFITATLVDPNGEVIKIRGDREEMDVPVK